MFMPIAGKDLKLLCHLLDVETGVPGVGVLLL